MYYDGTKLLSMLDLNGNKPEIYICCGNRTGGKTTYFNRWCVNRFLSKAEKFCLLYRFKYELNNVAEKFFKDINELFFPEYRMIEKKQANGIFYELLIQKKTDNSILSSCGYAIPINSADQIKLHSHFFSDVQRIIFDEFQSETGHYCHDEIKKLLSIHTSIARGQGKQQRYVPLVMISNNVSIINPYFTALKISNRLTTKTKFLKGNGFVLEQCYVESAAESQKNSAFNQAFADDSYVSYSSQNIYLNDNNSFIEKMEGKSRYIATIKIDNKFYAIREYVNQGIMYCDDKYDSTFIFKISVTTDDHDINYIMLKNNSVFISSMKYYFERGCFRFKNANCKNAILKLLSY